MIVTEGIHDRFVAAMIARMKTLKIDDALKPGTEIGPVVDQRQLDKNLHYIEVGRKEGARLAEGGGLLKRETDGYYMAPALFTESSSAMRINTDEIFGPVAAVIRVKDYEEALAVANATEFGLSAGIVTTSLATAISGATAERPRHGEPADRWLDYHVLSRRPEEVQLRSSGEQGLSTRRASKRWGRRPIPARRC